MTVFTSRFGPSTLHQRDPRSALFDSYTGDRNSSNRAASASPAAGGYTGYAGSTSSSGVGAPGGGSGMMMGQVNGGFRSATPNSRYVYMYVNE